MFARVKLILAEHKDVPVILKEAIMGKAPDAYVFVVEGGKARLQKIAAGIHEGPNFEITEGLKEDDLIIVEIQEEFKDKAKVEIAEVQEGLI